jgi:glutamate/tyrosine decarboxylase-like PLP-dependent enzyme
VRDAAALQSAMKIDASYLPPQAEGERIPCFLVPELSRRARGIPTWAMLKSLGRKGVEGMVARHCGIAKRIAERLATEDGVRVLNEVVLNQVVVSFGCRGAAVEDRRGATEAVLAALRESGEIFVGGSHWRGEWVMRISVICDATMPADADAVADVILAAWAEVQTVIGKGRRL